MDSFIEALLSEKTDRIPDEYWGRDSRPPLEENKIHNGVAIRDTMSKEEKMITS